MVYAVWAARREFAETNPGAVREVIGQLNGSLAYCRDHLDDIADYAARWEPFAPEHFRSYFDALQFRFEPRYREGLLRYLQEAHDIGQLETRARTRDLRWRRHPGSLTMTTPLGPRQAAAAIANSAAAGTLRLTPEQAVMLLRDGDLLDLGAAASAMRRRMVPGNDVTFIVDRNVNYTNVCVSGCRFCAFYRSAEDSDAYVLTREELAEKVAETIDLDGTAILLQGGMHPDLDIAWYETMLREIKADHPGIHVHGFGPPEIVHIARISGISTREVLSRLSAAGLDSLPGGGAEILVDRVRGHVSPKKATSDEWLNVMREAHQLDISTTATMMFGGVETVEERVEHMARVREVQDEAVAGGHVGFRAFIPWSFQPGNTALAEDEYTASGEWMTRGKRLGVPAHARGLSAVPRLGDQHPGVVGHPGRQGRPGRPRVWRQRHGLDDDRGERGGCRRHQVHAGARGTGPAGQRRRLRAGAARHALPRGAAVLVGLSFRIIL